MASDYDMGYSAKQVMVRARAVVTNGLIEFAGDFRRWVKYVWAAQLPGMTISAVLGAARYGDLPNCSAKKWDDRRG